MRGAAADDRQGGRGGDDENAVELHARAGASAAPERDRGGRAERAEPPESSLGRSASRDAILRVEGGRFGRRSTRQPDAIAQDEVGFRDPPRLNERVLVGQIPDDDVVVTKRTETFLGVTQLQGIVPAPGGAIVPSPVWTGVRMEIIGDSISCGYGVLGTDAFCPFSADTEAETEAWGALAARELSAAHTTIAWSGLGLYRNYDGVTTDTMPLLYGRAIGDDPESTWDHSFVPDVVVVALGTNDFAGGKGDPGSVFETTYVAFLEELRSIHPKAHLAVATSPMLSGNNRAKLLEYATAAVAARVNAGDANVSLVDLDEQRELDGYGCNHHPNVVTQRKMAAKLVAHLRARLGL